MIMTNNPLYDFHHSLDTLTLQAANRVLKLSSLKKAQEHFDIDFLNDIGIINLLRKYYLESGDFKSVFHFYQESRLENKSHRYESLFALLVVTVVGSVISGIILEIYKDNKKRLSTLVTQEIIDRVTGLLKTNKTLEKFCQSDARELSNDFKLLRKSYTAREMLTAGKISTKEYEELLMCFHSVALNKGSTKLMEDFQQFEKTFLEKNVTINETKILETSIVYAKGTVLQYLDNENIRVPNDPALKASYVIQGIGAAPGYALAPPLLFERSKVSEDNVAETILLIDSRSYSSNDVRIIVSSKAIITWNSGMTSHIPVICRGLRKACVILQEGEIEKIVNSELVEIFGVNGVVLTGELAKERDSILI